MAEAHREEIAKLEALYAAHPEGRVFTHLAEACRKAGELQRAREILEEGLVRHADYSSAHVVLGRVLIDLGDNAAAAESFRRVLELDRHNLVALRTLGQIAETSGNREEALRHYRDLQTLDPTDESLRVTIRDLEAGEAGHAAEGVIEAVEPAIEDAELAAESMAAQASAEPEIVAGSARERAEPDESLAEPGPAWPDEIETASELAGAGFDLSGLEPAEPEPELEEQPLSVDWGSIGEEEEAFPGDLASLAGEEPSGAEEPVAGDLETWSLGVEATASREDEAAEPIREDARATEAEEEPGTAEREEFPAAELSVGTTDGEVLTVTMAELYANQGIYDRAAEVYRSLLSQIPNDPRLLEGLAQMEARLGASAPEPAAD